MVVHQFPIGGISPGVCSHRLTIATMVKNEAPNLLEWLAFHRLQGVTHFIVYDNGSTDNTRGILQPLLERGIVTLVDWPHAKKGLHTQSLSYRHAIMNYGAATQWLAFIDVDEFLHSPASDSLLPVLDRCEGLPALVVLRHTFGTSGHETPPPGLVIDNYTWRIAVPPGPIWLTGHFSPKSIVRPYQVRATNGAHRFRLKGTKAYGFDVSGRPAGAYRKFELPVEELCINHYYTKDRATFLKRIQRGKTGSNIILGKDHWLRMLDEIETAAIVEDTCIRRFSAAVRNEMAALAAK